MDKQQSVLIHFFIPYHTQGLLRKDFAIKPVGHFPQPLSKLGLQA